MRLRRVDAGKPKTSAAPPLPAIRPSVICKTSEMCSLSASASVGMPRRAVASFGLSIVPGVCRKVACSEVSGVDTFDHFEPSCVIRVVASGNEPLSTAPVERITERSIQFCSSRMLPGHECRARASMNSSEMAVTRFRMRAAQSIAKWWTSKGMSSRRSRSGGSSIGNTLSR